jgi:hypothetical protein
MNDQPTPEEQAKMIGNRIGLLLGAASLPDEVKQAYATLIPEMTPEQIDALMKVLEKNIAGAPEIEAQKFVQNLEGAQEKFAKDQKAAALQADDEMNKIENLLDQLEN